jgi:hypothetical protein
MPREVPENGGAVPTSPSWEPPDLAPPPPGSIVLRVHRVRAEVVVAACDSELLGTYLGVGKTRVPVTSQFYGRRVVTEEEFVHFVRQGTIVNLLGKRTLAWALRAGLVGPEGTGTLGGVPHAEIIQML